MRELYNFVSGPLVWVAFAVFFLGCLYRLIRMFSLINRNEKFIFSYMSLKYSLRSIFHWSIPFGTINMRLHPVMTIVTFAFHFCLIATPLLCAGHGTYS